MTLHRISHPLCRTVNSVNVSNRSLQHPALRGYSSSPSSSSSSTSASPVPPSAASSAAAATATTPANGHPKSSKPHNGKHDDKIATRDLFLSVLGATTTKRDAKSYLSHFTPDEPHRHQRPKPSPTAVAPIRVALIKIRSLQSQDDATVDGLARTISQLNRLGLRCVVVLDCMPDDSDASPSPPSRRVVFEQADRMVAALENIVSTKAARLDDLFSYSELNSESCPTVQVRGAVEVQFSSLLSKPLKRGLVAVIPSIAFSTDTQQVADVSPDDIVLALTREFAGFRSTATQYDPATASKGASNGAAKSEVPTFTLDRIILLDPAGAIPSIKRADAAHVFVNMEQEYDDIRAELAHEFPAASRADTAQHLQNLALLRNTLALLPPTSSALLTVPAEAISPSRAHNAALGVGTRRPKNPLIFNLLTDKPLVSSSLPTARMSRAIAADAPPRNIVTSAKRGMPLTIIPDPRTTPWSAPAHAGGAAAAGSGLALDAHPGIDLPRLLALIEDSFGRPLDVPAYLARVSGRIAGVIVAGAYEGGAILTWETPPPRNSNNSIDNTASIDGGAALPAPAAAPEPVPYLDKFAVRRRSQGVGGVADIVFSAMVRSCFPGGVCWRSRTDNPVNRWYFERASGSWRIPGTGWTMFWTGPAVEGGRVRDYERVCRAVRPTWADGKAVLD